MAVHTMQKSATIVFFVWIGAMLLARRLTESKTWFSIARKPHSRPTTANTTKASSKVGAEITRLINEDGAGQWPPAAESDHWPGPLQAYRFIYTSTAPLLATGETGLSEHDVVVRRKEYRAIVSKLLNEQVDVDKIHTSLEIWRQGPLDMHQRKSLNGFFACISMLRHAYRWASIPVTKSAQAEKLVTLPLQLDYLWSFFLDHFGITSPSGNVTSNFLCNFDEHGTLAYQINPEMPETTRRAEYHFAHIFVVMEKLALPMYTTLHNAILAFESNQHHLCLTHTLAAGTQLKSILRVFHDTLVEQSISSSIWLRYVQGFQGRGAGELLEGRYIEYDGLSGN
ncbi:Hypothetical protein D9617_13g099000 [Elsinoe fawcettii]|nr:Hypothetical protein D9617_13g099000 [Elsinoe fawcettii]